MMRGGAEVDGGVGRAFPGERAGGDAEVRMRDLRVPHRNVIGEAGGGFAMGQHRLGYGRLRHGMWSIAKAQRALDMAAQYALERRTFGQMLADRQGGQWVLADFARDLYIAPRIGVHTPARPGKDGPPT